MEKMSREALELIFSEAHTTRSFVPGSASAADVEAIWEDIKFGPTAFNALPMRMTVVSSEAGRERLLPHLAEGNRPATADAPVTIICAADPEFPQLMADYGMPAGLVDFIRSDASTVDGIATSSAWLQAGYLILALRAHGFAVGPMTGADMGGLDQEFHKQNGWRSFLVLNVGKADPEAKFERAGRPSFEQIAQQV